MVELRGLEPLSGLGSPAATGAAAPASPANSPPDCLPPRMPVLSYTARGRSKKETPVTNKVTGVMVELRGLEPLTPRMPFWCSPN